MTYVFKKYNKALIFLSLVSLAFQPSLSWGGAPNLPRHSERESSLKRLENYLSSLKTLQADFIQINPNGSSSQGKFYLSRPGKMRLQYAPPSPLLLVADGNWLIQYDREMDEASYNDLESTPAAFLLRERVDFMADFKVEQPKFSNQMWYLVLKPKEEDQAGQVMLVFEDHPLVLRGWQIVDAEENITEVALSNIVTGGILKDSLFKVPNNR